MAPNRLPAFAIVLALAVTAICRSAGAADKVTYFVLTETVEPIMIVREGDPMAGGIMTEIVKSIFDGSQYVVEPEVLPWQRMRSEFTARDDWIVHGFPESFEPDIPTIGRFSAVCQPQDQDAGRFRAAPATGRKYYRPITPPDF